MFQRNGLLATRFKVLSTAHERTMSQGETHCDWQKSHCRMQSKGIFIELKAISDFNKFFSFLTVRKCQWAGAVLLQAVGHMLWAFYWRSMRRDGLNIFTRRKMWLSHQTAALPRRHRSMLRNRQVTNDLNLKETNKLKTFDQTLYFPWTGTTGPCPAGHLFTVPDNGIQNQHAVCQCKESYTSWSDGQCYRLYTRGPCGPGEFIVNSTACIKNPCGKGRLFFPEEKTCYRTGSQGPCNFNQVVVFDFTARPSIDGISYNGVCGCSGLINSWDQQCQPEEIVENPCHSTPGMVEINGKCYKLYTRGPCGPGLWLEPRKIIKRNDKRGAHCQCKPGKQKKGIG